MNTKRFIYTVEHTHINGYSDEAQSIKTDWLKTGKRILRKLSKELVGETYDIRINPAGVAGSGDVILHGDHIYVSFNQSALGNDYGFMWRTCNGRKDYTGHTNQWMKWDRLNDLVDVGKVMTFAIGQKISDSTLSS